MEFQTKDGECFMKIYKKGDKFDNGQFRKIEAIGSCESLTCQFEAAKESVWTMGYYGGFSRSFDVWIYCDPKGRITDKIKIYQLNYHKGIMHGKLGELKGKGDNYKIIEYTDFKKGKIIPAKKVRMTTNGWLDKFREDSSDGGKKIYETILYLFNLKDGEEAMKIWFVLRYRLKNILEFLKKELKLKKDEAYASVFLSNNLLEIFKFADIEMKNAI